MWTNKSDDRTPCAVSVVIQIHSWYTNCGSESTTHAYETSGMRRGAFVVALTHGAWNVRSGVPAGQ